MSNQAFGAKKAKTLARHSVYLKLLPALVSTFRSAWWFNCMTHVEIDALVEMAYLVAFGRLVKVVTRNES